MANYYGKARTSYMKVIDEEKFKAWAATIRDIDVITKKHEEYGMLYGLVFVGEFGGIVTSQYNEETDKEEDVEFYDEVQMHIAEGWSLIVMETGSEKMRYLFGYAAVITPEDIRTIEINNWAEYMMQDLGGPHHTKAQY